jgi:hypothetical protein
MILFEKYGKPKQFLQNHLRITPLDKVSATDGLRLSLVSKSMAIQLPLDSLGRTAFPLSKAAFDDNAELRLNRKTGLFAFSPWLSIVTRADGVYEASDLHTACEQALSYLQGQKVRRCSIFLPPGGCGCGGPVQKKRSIDELAGCTRGRGIPWRRGAGFQGHCVSFCRLAGVWPNRYSERTVGHCAIDRELGFPILAHSQ